MVDPGRSASTQRTALNTCPWLIFCGLALAAAACGGKEKGASGPSQPLEERRALQVIGRAIEGEGLAPVAGRPVLVATETSIVMDVGVDGRKFGVAYTSLDERSALGPALPARQYEGQLQLVKGIGADDGARVLVLHATDYLIDDQYGTDYEASTITAERALGRDVRDFIVEAQENRWP